MRSQIVTAGGKLIDLPVNDPELHTLFAWSGSYTDELIRQTSDARWYDPLFKGEHDLTFVDLGANIGIVSIYAHDVCRAILAVEPSNNIVNLCRLTAPYPNIVCANYAVHSEEGSVRLMYCQTNSTAHSTAIAVGDQWRMVQCHKLSSILGHMAKQWGSVDVVKVDIEGAEMVSVTQSEIESVRDSVKHYYIETHNVGLMDAFQCRNVLQERFERSGYKTEITSSEALLAHKH